MDSIVKITLWVPGPKALNEVLSAAKVEHDCGSPKQDAEGNFEITLYTTPEEAKKIKALPYRYEVDDNYGKVLKQRQKEVSKTDRFQGGKIKPEGLGVKR